MNIFKALVKRELLDGKNGYLRVPVILAGVTVALLVLSSPFGNTFHIEGLENQGITNLGEAAAALEQKEPEQHPAAITLGYWAMSGLTWMALPFVVFFSLLGSLYEERRDRSILFWKSMPVADWQEVAAKLFVPIVIAPLIFLAVTIAAQLLIAMFLSLVVAAQGGPGLVLWPLAYMVSSWFAMISMYFIHAFWLLPLLAWVLLVSAYANRMPFLWAVLIPVVLIVSEEIFLNTHVLGNWVGTHMGGWLEGAFHGNHREFHSPDEVVRYLLGGPQRDALVYSLTSLQFWAGLIVSGGIIYATIEKRKRAI